MKKSTQVKRPLFSLPDRQRLKTFLAACAVQSVWFSFVYVGCNWITSQRQDLIRVHFEFEEHWPFVPDLIWIYSSLYVLIAAIPFIVDSVDRLKRLAWVFMIATGIAGPCFLLIPAEPDFTTPEKLGLFPVVFQISDWVNLDYNQIPSLHVAFAVICVEEFCRFADRRVAILLRLYAIAIAASAVLTFQHHLVDVISGFVSGVVCYWAVERVIAAENVKAS